jgi:hypothetical protein
VSKVSSQTKGFQEEKAPLPDTYKAALGYAILTPITLKSPQNDTKLSALFFKQTLRSLVVTGNA